MDGILTVELVSPDGHSGVAFAPEARGGEETERKRPSRNERHKRRLAALNDEVVQLQSLADTLLGHLEAAIRPGLTDADRIRYRCMVQDIREELNNEQP